MAYLQTIYAAAKACVRIGNDPTETFSSSIGVKPCKPSDFGLYLDGLQELLENAAYSINCACLACIPLAILVTCQCHACVARAVIGANRDLLVSAACLRP